MNPERYHTFLAATTSLFLVKGARNGTPIRDAFKAAVDTPMGIPLETEMTLIDDLVIGLSQPGIKSDEIGRPYWMKGVEYDPYDVFATCVQFVDDYKAALPQTTLPPENDVREYIDFILESSVKLSIKAQWLKLLQISGGNPSGAANLGMIATRLIGRASDTSAYPDCPADAEIVYQANNKLTQFEMYGSNTADALGDTYYFWTYIFASLTLSSRKNSLPARILNKLFDNGSEIMYFVRSNIVGHSPATPHKEPSIIGRQCGLALYEYCVAETKPGQYSKAGTETDNFKLIFEPTSDHP